MTERPLRVLPVGDSLTYGYGDPSFAGYRGPLQTRLVARGLLVDFVGSLQSGPSTIDPDNEGHAGWQTDQLAAQLDGWLDTYQPDVVLLLAGTNDVVQGAGDTEARIAGLIDQIAGRWPDSLVVVSTLPPLLVPSANAERNRINGVLPGMVAALHAAGRNVRLVDGGDLDPATETVPGDGHPNVAGYAKMAAAWDAGLADLTMPGPPAGGSPGEEEIEAQAGDGVGNAFVFTSIPQGYRELRLSMIGRSTAPAPYTTIHLTFGPIGTIDAYKNETVLAFGAAGTYPIYGSGPSIALGVVPASASPPASLYSTILAELPGYSQPGIQRSILYRQWLPTYNQIRLSGGTWESVAPVTQIRLNLDAGAWTTGSRAVLAGVGTVP